MLKLVPLFVVTSHFYRPDTTYILPTSLCRAETADRSVLFTVQIPKDPHDCRHSQCDPRALFAQPYPAIPKYCVQMADRSITSTVLTPTVL